jgi:hypothetical protein
MQKATPTATHVADLVIEALLAETTEAASLDAVLRMTSNLIPSRPRRRTHDG